jgi:amino acid transporter/phospholipid N-methyltransferase
MAELKKSLGFFTIIALTITSMVGTGMFLGTSIGAGYAGNAVLIAWIILIILGIYVASCFGELVSLFPKAGGVYEFGKQSYGRFISFMIGWIAWLMQNIAITVLIIAALEFLLPAGFNSFARIGIAVGFILFFNLIAYFGVDASAAVLIFFAIESISLFIVIIVPGLSHINPANFTPFFFKPPIMIAVALFFMLEALMGWESASFLAEETKDAERIIPKALIITTIIAGLCGLGVAFISLGVIPWQVLAKSVAPISDISVAVLGAKYAFLINYGIVLALLGSVAGAIVSTPRLLLAMARDKLFIGQLAAIHEKRKTPYKAIVFQTAVSILLVFIAFGQYKVLLSLFTPIALIMYAFVLISVTILRYRLKDVKRAFKAPFGKIGPIIVSLLYISVIGIWLYIEPDAFKLFKIMLSLIFFGVPIYLLLVFFYNPDAIASFTNSFARLTLLMENILFPKRVRRHIISLFKDLEHKSVLEYGAGVGTLTLQLAKAVGPKGKIYATDISHRNINLLKKRLSKRGIDHVVVIHDEHHISRVHPSVKNVDFIFSVGTMSYMQDIKKILKEMNRLLPESGKICFVEYINFFRFLPDAEILSDIDKLKRTFREAGFSVKIEKKKSLLWNYLFVYGIKSEKDVPYV